MEPISLHLNSIMVLDGTIGGRGTSVLARGIFFHGGSSSEIKCNDGLTFKVPESFVMLPEIPIAGHWKSEYPDVDYYIITQESGLISSDVVISTVEKFFQEKYNLCDCLWEMEFGFNHNFSDIIAEGLNYFSKCINDDVFVYLYGWIDQAVLEITSVGKGSDLYEVFVQYRPDEGGDSGLIYLHGKGAICLDLSFEAGYLKIIKYDLN